MPSWREMRSVVVSWHIRQTSFAPLRPCGLVILVLSPPESACSLPSPWQGTQESLETCPLTTVPVTRACGLRANVFASSWHSEHAGGCSAAGAAAAGAGGGGAVWVCAGAGGGGGGCWAIENGARSKNAAKASAEVLI